VGVGESAKKQLFLERKSDAEEKGGHVSNPVNVNSGMQIIHVDQTNAEEGGKNKKEMKEVTRRKGTVTPRVFAQWCFVLMTLLTPPLTTHESPRLTHGQNPNSKTLMFLDPLVQV
jgi:hypothetical protein